MDDRDRQKIISFKVDDELGRLLDQLPNKSEFIRQAILAQFRLACSLCAGSGVVPRGIGEHYGDVFACCKHVRCEECGKAEPIPDDHDDAPPRWVHFLRSGQFFCKKCYGDHTKPSPA